MFSRFFINRPIFASVLSIVIVLAGVVAYRALPVAQYPEIAPPTVEVSASYPGANAQVVADTVAAPIEQSVNGVEGMMYMTSQCANDGTYTLTVAFRPGSDLNISQVLVQNREALAEPVLPDLVKRRGISVKKKSPNVLMIINLFSDAPKNSGLARNNLDLSNYATIQLRDELSRLSGVGDVTYLGQRDYSMRLWLLPPKLAAYGLNPQDVVNAVQAQNVQVAAGQIGQPPTPTGQVTQYIITTLGRLENTEQFEDIIVKNDGPSLVRLKDVARVELGAQAYDQTCTLDGRPSVALSIYQLPGSNALDVAERVKQRMRQLKQRFPPGMDYAIVYDTTPFINESIAEVRETLFDAVVLVALVVLVFLQNWRSALIPLIAVPVAIIGTFAVMAVMGFSLNNLTLFGLVLAIGIVVDDAIVVVEAVEHHIEHGLSPREASLRAMEQVSGPVVAIGLVLSAVFIPCAFITGIIGQFFRQFALTIAVSTLISAFNSLTLSPALSAILLRPRVRGKFEDLPWFAFAPFGAWIGHKLAHHLAAPALDALHLDFSSAMRDAALLWGPVIAGAVTAMLLAFVFKRPMNWLIGLGFRAFNRVFDASINGYTRAVSGLVRISAAVLVVYGGLLALTYWGFTHTPTGFIPQQDKGYLLVNVQLPDAAAVSRTQKVIRKIETIARKETPGVKHAVAIAGQSILLNANASNFGTLYLMLDDFDKRNKPELSGDAITAALQDRLQREAPEATVNIFAAPPVEGLGTAGGFKMMILDTGMDNARRGYKALQNVSEKAAAAAQADPHLQGVFSSFRADTPWLELVVNRAQAKDRGVSIDDLRTTIEQELGPYYINDFNIFGRTWQVTVQALDTYRRSVEQIRQLKVRNNLGQMVPLSTFTTSRFVPGPAIVSRYDLYAAAPVHADPGSGTSSGQAIDHLEKAVRSVLPHGMRPEWTELGLMQLQTGNTAMWVFLLAVVLVFLVLAAQYESWSLPLAVILVVPMCLLCAIAGVVMARMDINIFTQIGFLVLVGLACKNAILIVEFAKAQREEGLSRREATLAACQLRLRPIIMTSFAFILGVVPLMISTGAGAEMRQTLGTAVFAGMLGVTLFGIFLTPVFFYVIQWLKDRRAERALVPVAGLHHAVSVNGEHTPEPMGGRLGQHAQDILCEPVLIVLEERFGSVPVQVTNAVRHLQDEHQLAQLIRVATTCTSVEEFQARMND